MERTRFIEHQGKRVLLLDYSGAREPQEAIAAIRHSMQVVAAQPPKSLRVLTDVSDSRYNAAVLQALKELATHNEPYVRASAVVGVSGLRRIAYQAVAAFSGRKINLFDSADDALNWLTAQP